MPTFGSLFSGIGGFEVGLERAGWTCAFQVEIDPFCQRVLATRWPGVQRLTDVRAFAHQERDGRCGPVDGTGAGERADGGTTERDRGAHLDLLVGGFPCQDLSVAGKRAGLGGKRSGLFWEIVRIAKATCPTWGLFENVPGLVSSHRGSDMALVIAGLRECWPVVGWRILDSRYFGVAQRRRRVFFVCGPTEAGVAQVLALIEGGAGDLEAGGEAGADVAHAVSAGAGGSKFGSGRDGQDDFVIAETLSAGSNPNSNMAGRRREDDVNLVATGGSQQDQFCLPEGQSPTLAHSSSTHKGHHQPKVVIGFNWQSGGDARIGAKEEAVDALHSGQTPAICHALTGEGHDASEDGTGRGTPMVALEIADTLSVGANQTTGRPGDLGPAVGSAVRRLTPLECERLQGFPDGFTCLCQPLEAYAVDPDAAALACTCPDSPRYRALGNAVTVNVIEWIGRRLMAALAGGRRA